MGLGTRLHMDMAVLRVRLNCRLTSVYKRATVTHIDFSVPIVWLTLVQAGYVAKCLSEGPRWAAVPPVVLL